MTHFADRFSDYKLNDDALAASLEINLQCHHWPIDDRALSTTSTSRRVVDAKWTELRGVQLESSTAAAATNG